MENSNSDALQISFIYIIKSRGPNIEPHGTPHLTVWGQLLKFGVSLTPGPINITITVSHLYTELVILTTRVIIVCCVECFYLKPY